MRVRDLWLLVAVVASTACGLSCKSGEKVEEKCHAVSDGSVLACVGDDPIRRAEAQEFLAPAEWIPGSATMQDPRPVAVDKAIDMHVLAIEAKRRGLGSGASVAALAQLVIADEKKKRGISRDNVTDAEARQFFDDHPEAFGEIDSVRVQAIVVTDPKTAEAAYAEAKGLDEDGFAALVAKYSEDEPSKAKRGELPPIEAVKGTDRTLLTLVLGLRSKGSLGGPVKADDGRYYVVRVLDSHLSHVSSFDDQSMAKAKNILVFEQTQAMSTALVATLRASVVIRTFADAIAALEPPTPTAAATPSSSH
jgi:hypothetical protein